MTSKAGKAVTQAATKSGGANQLMLLEAVNEMTRHVTAYLTVAQQETTKRAAITAQRDVALAEIQAQRATIEQLIAQSFAERSRVLDQQFRALDVALSSGRIELAQSALGAMVDLVKSSPFKSVQEMQQAMSSKDFVIRLE